MKRIRNVVALSVTLLAAVPAVAAAAVKVSVSPQSPGPTTAITASYRTPAAIPSNYRWHLDLISAKHASSKTCTGFDGVYLQGPVAAGTLIKYKFKPSQAGHSKWCAGAWDAVAAYSKGSGSPKVVGYKAYKVS